MFIRPASMGDLPFLEDVERRCFTRDRFPRSLLRIMLVRGEFITLIAEDDERSVGYGSVLLLPESGCSRLVSLAVGPEDRGCGIGHLLLGRLEKESALMGIKSMTLEVDVTNIPALNLYLHEGFRIIGIINDYYGKGVDAYHMEKGIV